MKTDKIDAAIIVHRAVKQRIRSQNIADIVALLKELGEFLVVAAIVMGIIAGLVLAAMCIYQSFDAPSKTSHTFEQSLAVPVSGTSRLLPDDCHQHQEFGADAMYFNGYICSGTTISTTSEGKYQWGPPGPRRDLRDNRDSPDTSSYPIPAAGECFNLAPKEKVWKPCKNGSHNGPGLTVWSLTTVAPKPQNPEDWKPCNWIGGKNGTEIGPCGPVGSSVKRYPEPRISDAFPCYTTGDGLRWVPCERAAPSDAPDWACIEYPGTVKPCTPTTNQLIHPFGLPGALH